MTSQRAIVLRRLKTFFTAKSVAGGGRDAIVISPFVKYLFKNPIIELLVSKKEVTVFNDDQQSLKFGKFLFLTKCSGKTFQFWRIISHFELLILFC